MVEIYSKSLVGAISRLVKYYSRSLAKTPIKTRKGDEKWSLFVNKQLFRWSASIILDNNSGVLTDFLTLYFATYLSWPDCLYLHCFFSFENSDSFDYVAAFWFTFRQACINGLFSIYKEVINIKTLFLAY